jgi:putative ABC transport system substrate-binding protein
MTAALKTGVVMRRREFVTLLGGAMAAVPLAARAQQPKQVRHLLVLMGSAEDDPNGRAAIGALLQGFRQLGWTDRRNIRIDYRWAAGKPDLARAHAEEVRTLAPDVIIANGTQILTALQRARSSIPIVFVVVANPVGAGFVQDLARPGANITGFSTFEPEIGGKWLELLKEIEPGLGRVAGILDPNFSGFAKIWSVVELLASKLGVHITTITFRDPSDDIESTIASFAREPRGGLIVFPTPANSSARDRIFSLAIRHRLPAIYPFRIYAADGGLMAYGFDTRDLYRRSASYIDRILKGEKPGNLPVQAPTKYELVINLKTAQALRLNVPPTLLARADEVIE